jgi:hypothetical protein
MSKDNLISLRVTADTNSPSNGITQSILVHKITVLGGSNNVAQLDIAEAGGSTDRATVIAAATLGASENFDPPLPLKGLDVDITGSGGVGFVFYTREY